MTAGWPSHPANGATVPRGAAPGEVLLSEMETPGRI